MPRPKRPGAPEPKKRSRTGCWPCKARKVKCGEEKPQCFNCERQGETCDYSIKLSWGGRKRRTLEASTPTLPSQKSGTQSLAHAFRIAENISPYLSPNSPNAPPTPYSFTNHSRHSASPPASEHAMADLELMGMGHAESHSITSSYGRDRRYETIDLSQRQSLPSTASFDPRSATAPFQGRFEPDYASSSITGFESGGFSSAPYESSQTRAPLSPPVMHTPLYGATQPATRKRPRSEGTDLLCKNRQRSHSGASPAPSASMSPANTLAAGPPSPYNPFLQMPLTPMSLAGSDDALSRTGSRPSSYSSPDRRISVQSILAGPPGDIPRTYSPCSQNNRPSPLHEAPTTTYGYDPGYHDLDTPKNDDAASIVLFSPPQESMDIDSRNTFGIARTGGKEMAFEIGAYYAKPVPIVISKSLEPLPPLLLANPINLLYFHHFINHTARILVPHDCGQNPFKHILPEMAVHDSNILKLLLAFSASHRARLLNHPEPVNRIAEWVKDVFPTLRESITQNQTEISNATLAPALMLASLEIVSPNTFEVPIGWQNHLKIARQMILTRGAPRSDPVTYFLSRWFAYLDVLGSLSGNKNDHPLSSYYWRSEDASADEDYQIDCLMGFTNRCIGILARIAELAKHCESLRIDTNGDIITSWRPEPDAVEQAIVIRRELEDGIMYPASYKGCNHHSSTYSAIESEGAWDETEIYATNEMFHWGGLIHLYRRVLGKGALDPEVQHAVRQILGLLSKVRRGSTAEACLLFPMFAAGCDAHDSEQRETIMERLRCVEGFGIAQISKARSIIQKVWDTGKPWESLVEGEFFG